MQSIEQAAPARVPTFADLLGGAGRPVREVAREAGVAVSMLYRYRDGLATPRARRRARLARALRTSVADLALALELARLRRQEPST